MIRDRGCTHMKWNFLTKSSIPFDVNIPTTFIFSSVHFSVHLSVDWLCIFHSKVDKQLFVVFWLTHKCPFFELLNLRACSYAFGDVYKNVVEWMVFGSLPNKGRLSTLFGLFYFSFTGSSSSSSSGFIGSGWSIPSSVSLSMSSEDTHASWK